MEKAGAACPRSHRAGPWHVRRLLSAGGPGAGAAARGRVRPDRRADHAITAALDGRIANPW